MSVAILASEAATGATGLLGRKIVSGLNDFTTFMETSTNVMYSLIG